MIGLSLNKHKIYDDETPHTVNEYNGKSITHIRNLIFAPYIVLTSGAIITLSPYMFGQSLSLYLSTIRIYERLKARYMLSKYMIDVQSARQVVNYVWNTHTKASKQVDIAKHAHDITSIRIRYICVIYAEQNPSHHWQIYLNWIGTVEHKFCEWN